MDGLPELLSSCDYICNLLPSTPETRGVLNGDVFRHCAKKVHGMRLPSCHTEVTELVDTHTHRKLCSSI